MSFDYAALERRVGALEAAQPASLRFGRVTGVSGGKALFATKTPAAITPGNLFVDVEKSSYMNFI